MESYIDEIKIIVYIKIRVSGGNVCDTMYSDGVNFEIIMAIWLRLAIVMYRYTRTSIMSLIHV